MPPVKGEQCLCHICLASNPKGEFIPHGRLKLHRRRIAKEIAARTAQLEEGSHNATEDTNARTTQPEEEALLHSETGDLLDDVGVKNFFSNINGTTQALTQVAFSRLVTSIGENQRAEQIRTSATTRTLSDSIDAIMQSVDRLEQPSTDIRSVLATNEETTPRSRIS